MLLSASYIMLTCRVGCEPKTESRLFWWVFRSSKNTGTEKPESFIFGRFLLNERGITAADVK